MHRYPFYLVLLFSLLAGSANADEFAITFTATSTIIESSGTPRNPLGFVGTFTTDGNCTICTISQSFDGTETAGGLLSVDIKDGGGSEDFGLGSGTYQIIGSFFVNFNPMDGSASYDRTTNTFGAEIANFSSEFINLGGSYGANMGGDVIETGTISIASVPEPQGTLLQATVLAGVGVLAALKRKVGRRRISFAEN